MATRQSMVFNEGAFEYFLSNQDLLKSYNESKFFCEKWGGNLLSLQSEWEYQQIVKKFDYFRGEGNSVMIWYGEDPFKFTYELSKPKHVKG